MKLTQFGISLTAVMAIVASMPALLSTPRAFADSTVQEAVDPSDYRIQVDLGHQLNKDRFKDVRVSVADGVITLTGNVELFADREAAEKKAIHAKKDVAVRNQIRIRGARIPDEDLQSTLVKKLQHDRVGYGSTAFNAISVSVRDGVVTLGGHAYGPMDKSSALSVASYTPGVQEVIDAIDVDPVSPMDDMIRLRVARLVYGSSSLSKYAIDPGKPIRISVRNGNATLYGSVDSQADRDMAGILANSAAGVFKVTNELHIENASSEPN
jgi:hyperosmotically inducible periplasmic protein